MLTKEIKKDLEKQQYRLVGNHSAVKICGWTKNMLQGKGGCYKMKFYGIQSNQCLQMTTCLSCANRCIFCWRDYKEPVSAQWQGPVDLPEQIFQDSIKAQYKLLTGFKGNEKTPSALYRKSTEVKHVALSLTGEPILYPKINELIEIFRKNKISTFLVTNAQYPEQIKSLSPVTQLYISLDAPNKELLKKIDNPVFPDFWPRLLQSLKYMSERKERTAIRLTLIKKMNMIQPENYAKLILIANPDFIEVKSYMHVGSSRLRLQGENMPSHIEVKAFSKKLLKYLPDYEIANEHKQSRVVLLAKKKFKKNTLIDFDNI
jgi:tRNA wybutosine-synthesizing protein 1